MIKALALMLALLALAGTQAIAQAADPPGRVARLGHAEGEVSFLAAGDDEWVAAPRNRPVTRGDQLWTDRGARAELHLGSTALRMNGRTQLQFSELDDRRARLNLPQGQASLRVRRLDAGERLEVDTPNLSLRVTQPGSYRLDVDPARGTTRVTLHAGQARVYGSNGQSLGLSAPQQISFTGRALAQLGTSEEPVRDDFDEWAAARDRAQDRSASARYLSREVPGYHELDAYGDWRVDPAYGPVWFPYVTVAGWAPYRWGHWEYIPPWGWTWIDDAPWGFAPFHYGRWVMVSLRWCWVPGPIVLQPVYAPALVGFVGGSAGQVVLGPGRPGLAWFPLAPGEAFRPAYRASPAYLARLNRHQRLPEGDRPHRFQREPQAVTAAPREAFLRGRPLRGEALPLARTELDRARVVALPRLLPERRREEDGMRRAPPDRIPPGWSPRRQQFDGHRDMRAVERPARREDAPQGRAERERRAMQERAQGRPQEGLRQPQREHSLQRERALPEQAERQQRAMQEQAQRQQQRAERIEQRRELRERPQEEKRRLHGERRQRTEAEEGRR